MFWIKSGAADSKFARIPTHSGLTIDPPPAPTFEVAPDEAAINDWECDFDHTNKTVTLKYYKGSKTNVIVYGNYLINGETYKTRLASNSDTAEYYTPYMFNGHVQSNCKNIQKITFSNRIDTSNVTNMAYMFNVCFALMSLDVSNFDTSNVENMAGMFRGCHVLTPLDVSNFDTSNVENMSCMFQECKALTSLDVSNFDTSKVTNMLGMFINCNALTTLNLSNFNISNVENMACMFQNCRSLTTIDLSNFNTSNVTTTENMFRDCSNLTSLTFTPENWVKKSGCNTSYMFDNCPLGSDPTKRPPNFP